MKYIIKQYSDIKEKVALMCDEELLKAVCCPDLVAGRKREDSVETPLVFLHPSSEATVAETVKTLKEKFNDELIILGDLECGSGSVITGQKTYPSFMALGEADDEELAYNVGRSGGKAAYDAGFRWSLAPCADIILNHNTPITSIRAAGSDVRRIIKICGAYMRGQQHSGIASTIKHFPGDGLTSYDQHITTPENPLDMESWWKTYGKIYKEMIEQGAMSIMPGHISLPAYDEPYPENGLYPPATISYKLMTKLLKEELGFEGIICSDAVTMSGFCGFVNIYKACALFLKNGGDVLLFQKYDENFIIEMKKHIQSGFLSREILRERVYRVLCFMRELSEFNPDNNNVISEDILCREVVEKSIRVVRDRNNLLPFKPKKDKKILHVTIMQNKETSDKFNEKLMLEGYEVEYISDCGPDHLCSVAQSGEYSLIICSCSNAPSYGTNVVHTHGPIARNMMRGWTKFDTPVVFVSFYHPYFHREFEAMADTVINTYGVCNETYDSVIKKIFDV